MGEIKLCMGCMHPLPEGRTECGLCGYPVNGENPTEYLRVGTKLSDRYTVGRVLSVGGDSALYIGYDDSENTPVFVREFLPATLCERMEDGSLHPIGGCESTYGEYLGYFHTHVRALARLRDLPIMLPIFDIFDQNNTSYAVSEYAEGISLTRYVRQQGGRLSWEEARRLFLPLLTAVASCHTAGVYHYGISPDTLLVGSDGRLRLTGFTLPQVRTVNTDLKPQLQAGYAAPEQYDFGRECTPATDVYGIAATLFFVLTGNPPPEGTMRDAQGRDLLLPREVSAKLPNHVAAALSRALEAVADRRTQTVLELRDQLSSEAVVSSLTDEPIETPHAKKKNGVNKYMLISGIFLALAIVVVAVIVLFALYPDLISGPTESKPVSMPQTTTGSDYTPPTQGFTFEAPNLAGKHMDYYSLPVSQGAVQYNGYTVELDGLVFSDLPYGSIVSQSPAAGETVEEGATIRVVISAGKEQTQIPSVKGWKAEHAKLYLEALGFKVTILEEEFEGVEKGFVIGTLPEEGKTPDPGKGNSITLRVSTWEKPKTTTTTARSTTTTSRRWKPFG